MSSNVLRNALEAVDTLPDARIDLRALPQSTRGDCTGRSGTTGRDLQNNQLANGPQPFTSAPNQTAWAWAAALPAHRIEPWRPPVMGQPARGSAVVSVWLPIAEGAHGKD